MHFFTVAIVVCAGLVFGHASPPADEGPGSCQAKMTAFPLEPGSKCCTQVSKNTNVEGGHVAELDQHPWAALIEYKLKKTGLTKRLCAGTLISGKYILTAAHCITGRVLDIATPTTVRLGEYDWSHEGRDCVPVSGGGENCNDVPISITIETTIAHPKYYLDHPSRWNDIGLIRLKEAAPYTDFIRPICLPTTNPESNPPDHPFYAIGWNDTAKAVFKMPFVNQEKCKPIFSAPGRKIALGDGQLCAGGIKGMDTCKGDGGGPLVYENQEGLFELTGIISFGSIPCGLEGIPSVFTNVYEYLDWIKTIIKS